MFQWFGVSAESLPTTPATAGLVPGPACRLTHGRPASSTASVVRTDIRPGSAGPRWRLAALHSSPIQQRYRLHSANSRLRHPYPSGTVATPEQHPILTAEAARW